MPSTPPLETLANITQIQFPRELDYDAALNYFAFLCQKVPCAITSKFGQFVNIGSRLELEENPEKVSVEYGTAEWSGSLAKTNAGFVIASFTLARNIGESVRSFTGMSFSTTPGYKLHELDPKEVQFYRDLQSLTQEYFRQGCPEVSKKYVPDD